MGFLSGKQAEPPSGFRPPLPPAEAACDPEILLQSRISEHKAIFVPEIINSVSQRQNPPKGRSVLAEPRVSAAPSRSAAPNALGTVVPLWSVQAGRLPEPVAPPSPPGWDAEQAYATVAESLRQEARRRGLNV